MAFKGVDDSIDEPTLYLIYMLDNESTNIPVSIKTITASSAGVAVSRYRRSFTYPPEFWQIRTYQVDFAGNLKEVLPY